MAHRSESDRLKHLEWFFGALGVIASVVAYWLLCRLFFHHGGIVDEELGTQAEVFAIIFWVINAVLAHDRKIAEAEEERALGDIVESVRRSKTGK